MSSIRLGIETSLAVALLAPALFAQGVAFQPVVGSLPSGPILNTTPAVSLDRRHVRLGINAQFIDNAAFSTYNVPAAVGGGPNGPGALGGLGLGGAGGGAGVGGAGAGGGQFLAGMNGVIDPSVGYYPTGFPPGGTAMGFAFPFQADPMDLRATAQGFQAQPPMPQRATPAKAPKRGRSSTVKKKQPPVRSTSAPTAPH